MRLNKVEFYNKQGEKLVGRMEFPADQHPHSTAIFAHCFTCTKNLAAVKHISRALSGNGFAVLRFDFTGLGESEGDFADSNFSGNVADLIAAADYLSENHLPPSLLVGHSLGGAAVLFAGAEIESVRAIATVGAPSDPTHVKRLLKSDIEEIETTGAARVNLEGRDFSIKKQFLDDLENNRLSNVVPGLKQALLFMHSPQDLTVELKNAETLYHLARHPKSFVTLDGADHLLSRKEDSIYAGELIASWASRYLRVEAAEPIRSKHQVVAALSAEDGFSTAMKIGNHYSTADEPVDFGGNDFGPSPYEFVSAGLSACTAMTLQMYSKRKKWDLQRVEVHTSYSKTHAVDCEACENPEAKIDTFEREIILEGDLDEKQQQRLLQIADKCPVHKTLHSDTQILTSLKT